ncbi:hypothetical protein P3T42_007291 [Paraburkholderia sp. GAS38]
MRLAPSKMNAPLWRVLMRMGDCPDLDAPKVALSALHLALTPEPNEVKRGESGDDCLACRCVLEVP